MASKQGQGGGSSGVPSPGGRSPGGSPARGGSGPEGFSDAEAVARAREGDHEAFRVLVERYQGRVFRLAQRVLRDPEQARDAVQEAFLKVYGSLRRFEGRSSFYTWLYRLVLNLCLDMRRRDRSDRHVEWSEARADDVLTTGEIPTELPRDGGSASPEAAVGRSQLRTRMVAAIQDLPDNARETLVLREVEGLSYAEIAQVLGIPKGTVMSRLHYARKRVQKELIDSGLVEAEADRGARDRRGSEGQEDDEDKEDGRDA